MTIIEQARALGAALQEDERYKRYAASAEANDTDPGLQRMIGEFNMMRRELNYEMTKTEKDAERLTALDTDIRALYDRIMEMPGMIAYNAAKDELDQLINSINYIITQAASGEDPMTCDEKPMGCGGSCATCGGCG